MSEIKQIVITVDFPADQEDKLMSELAGVLGYREGIDGTKTEFVTQKAQGVVSAWFAMTYRRVFNKPVIKKDVGFGDTLARWIGYLFVPFKWLSMNCGCDKKRKWLNKRFPY